MKFTVVNPYHDETVPNLSDHCRVAGVSFEMKRCNHVSVCNGCSHGLLGLLPYLPSVASCSDRSEPVFRQALSHVASPARTHRLWQFSYSLCCLHLCIDDGGFAEETCCTRRIITLLNNQAQYNERWCKLVTKLYIRRRADLFLLPRCHEVVLYVC